MHFGVKQSTYHFIHCAKIRSGSLYNARISGFRRLQVRRHFRMHNCLMLGAPATFFH